jgi:hypothetical protein
VLTVSLHRSEEAEIGERVVETGFVSCMVVFLKGWSRGASRRTDPRSWRMANLHGWVVSVPMPPVPQWPPLAWKFSVLCRSGLPYQRLRQLWPWPAPVLTVFLQRAEGEVVERVVETGFEIFMVGSLKGWLAALFSRAQRCRP